MLKMPGIKKMYLAFVLVHRLLCSPTVIIVLTGIFERSHILVTEFAYISGVVFLRGWSHFFVVPTLHCDIPNVAYGTDYNIQQNIWAHKISFKDHNLVCMDSRDLNSCP